MFMNLAFLLTGGNLGSRAENLENAKTQVILRTGRLLAASSLYETAAWGKQDQPDYLNQVLLIETALSPTELLEIILTIEKNLGRERKEKYDARLIDIDILFYNDEQIQLPELVIPHPLLHTRRFVLEPLCEIAPHFIHPVFNTTITELLAACNDPLNVKKFYLE
jgi:2-amino-4-hydroxy-6-hydroxymethyldihydropteridine diphosphokinase